MTDQTRNAKEIRQQEVERLAKVIYDTEAGVRTRGSGRPSAWVPWELQPSYQERRVYYACAEAVIDALAEPDLARSMYCARLILKARGNESEIAAMELADEIERLAATFRAPGEKA